MNLPAPRLAHGRFIARLGPPMRSLRAPQPSAIQLDDGSRAQAYIKDLPPRELTVEIVCALLLDAVALPGARPALVAMPQGGAPQFGSIMLPWMPFSHALASDPVAYQRLQAWPQLIPAAAFDEWIANPDRHHNNILHDGRRAFWLIDHGCAADAVQAIDAPCDPNTLFEVARDGMDATALTTALKPRLRAAARAFASATLTALKLEIAADSLPAVEEVLGFLAARHAQLLNVVDQRLPQGQQDIFDDTRH